MTNDKDSAVPDSGLEAAIHKAQFIYNEICRFGYGDLRRTVLDHVEQLAALRQPTQSDVVHKMGWCFSCDTNECAHIQNANAELRAALQEQSK